MGREAGESEVSRVEALMRRWASMVSPFPAGHCGTCVVGPDRLLDSSDRVLGTVYQDRCPSGLGSALLSDLGFVVVSEQLSSHTAASDDFAIESAAEVEKSTVADRFVHMYCVYCGRSECFEGSEGTYHTTGESSKTSAGSLSSTQASDSGHMSDSVYAPLPSDLS